MTTNEKPGVGMMLLSPVMYRFACHLAHSAERDSFSPAMASPMAAVLHATASLEASLNEQIARWISADAHWRDPLEAIDRLEFDKKWTIVPRLLFGRTFDTDREPFQSFRALVRLRNDVMHYKPRFEAEETVPKYVRDLRARFAFSSTEQPEGFPPVRDRWMSLALNRECAAWACRTAREMVLAWHDLQGDKRGREVADWEWSDAYLDGRKPALPAGVVEIKVSDEPKVVQLVGFEAAQTPTTIVDGATEDQ